MKLYEAAHGSRSGWRFEHCHIIVARGRRGFTARRQLAIPEHGLRRRCKIMFRLWRESGFVVVVEAIVLVRRLVRTRSASGLGSFFVRVSSSCVFGSCGATGTLSFQSQLCVERRSMVLVLGIWESRFRHETHRSLFRLYKRLGSRKWENYGAKGLPLSLRLLLSREFVHRLVNATVGHSFSFVYKTAAKSNANSGDVPPPPPAPCILMIRNFKNKCVVTMVKAKCEGETNPGKFKYCNVGTAGFRGARQKD